MRNYSIVFVQYRFIWERQEWACVVLLFSLHLTCSFGMIPCADTTVVNCNPYRVCKTCFIRVMFCMCMLIDTIDLAIGDYVQRYLSPPCLDIIVLTSWDAIDYGHSMRSMDWRSGVRSQLKLIIKSEKAKKKKLDTITMQQPPPPPQKCRLERFSIPSKWTRRVWVANCC